MSNNKMQTIVKRVNKIDDEYKIPLTVESLNNLARICPGKNLPEDFLSLNKVCRGDFFSFFDFYNFDQGVVNKTLYFRDRKGLPDNYLLLFLDDVSAVLLKLISDKVSEVIWCDVPDLYNLCDGLDMEYKTTKFSTFTDFYEFLLYEEEKAN
jgi:hypothetical protein